MCAKILSATALGSDFSSAGTLPDTEGCWTVYLVANTTGYSSAGVILPINSDVGDVIELHCTGIGNPGFEMYAGGTDTLDGSASPSVGNSVSASSGFLMRKTQTGVWQNITRE